MFLVHCDNTTNRQVNTTRTGNMDDKLSPLELKLYLFYSANLYQRQEQRKITVEDKKYGSLIGPTTYISTLEEGRNLYGGKTNSVEFCK